MPDAQRGFLGVLLVNLGTPDAPTTAAVRRYLDEFLSDPRVVEAPRWLWWPVLHGFILRVRPRRSAAAYRKIWTNEGSPLLVHTTRLADSVGIDLARRASSPVAVLPAMSYGSPSIAGVLEKMLRDGATRIVVLPLYPQYSGSTTGSVFQAVTAALSGYRQVPAFRFIDYYCDAPAYPAAIAASIREAWDLRGRGERLLFSFHGLPRSMVEKGDPYYRQCLGTARQVTEALGLGEAESQVSFQSRVGREEWLRPYTDEVLQQWGNQRMGKIDVVCPGFAVDCLETLEEIAMQNAERFVAAGGGELRYIPALNTRSDHVSLLSGLVMEHAAGWVDSPPAAPGAYSSPHGDAATTADPGNGF
jgi:ferrochelatase